MSSHGAAHDFPLVVAVGASAGGVEALSQLVERLPNDFPAPILVVLHVAPAGTSVLAEILDRRTGMTVRAAVDGERLHPGRIYVAPPDQHLIVDGELVRVNREPRVNGHRPGAGHHLSLGRSRVRGARRRRRPLGHPRRRDARAGIHQGRWGCRPDAGPRGVPLRRDADERDPGGGGR